MKSNTVKILVLEDEVVVGNMMASMLRHAGFHVEVANSGQRGMEYAREEKFDLITLDLDLGDVDGFEVFRELKQRHISYRTPVVFVSGQATDRFRQRALELGAADFVAKPFELTDFITRISLAVGCESIEPAV